MYPGPLGHLLLHYLVLHPRAQLDIRVSHIMLAVLCVEATCDESCVFVDCTVCSTVQSAFAAAHAEQKMVSAQKNLSYCSGVPPGVTSSSMQQCQLSLEVSV